MHEQFRIDRALSLGIVQRLRWLRSARDTPPVPILMYHSIGPARGSAHPYYETATRPSAFAAQMHFLAHAGYRTLTLSQAMDARRRGNVPARLVVLTFDDGLFDFSLAALPILKQFGLVATLFAVARYAESASSGTTHGRYLSWRQVREAHACGIEIGSHSMTHAQLWRLNPQQIEVEIHDSKKAIEDEIGAGVTSFSYPHAFPEHDGPFLAHMRRRLASAGYLQAVTTTIGRAGRQGDPFSLPRLPINSYDDLRFFAAKLEGAYDWMHAAQSMRKRMQLRTRWNAQCSWLCT